MEEVRLVSPPYFSKIDHPPIAEYIDAVFDSATSFMTKRSFIFGGTINAIIAGLPIEGDLDIVVPEKEFLTLAQNFANSAAWTQVEGETIPEACHSGDRPHFWKPSYLEELGKPKRYRDSSGPPISRMVGFEAMGDRRVQIIVAKGTSSEPPQFSGVGSLIRGVDLRCCATAINHSGQVVEFIEGSYEDCLRKRLVVVKFQPREMSQTLQRIDKYVKRGWYLNPPLDKVVLRFKRAADKAREKHAAMKSAAAIPRKAISFRGTGNTPESWNRILIPKKDIRNSIRGADHIHQFAKIMDDQVKKMFKDVIFAHTISTATLQSKFWQKGGPTSIPRGLAESLMGRVIDAVNDKNKRRRLPK